MSDTAQEVKSEFNDEQAQALINAVPAEKLAEILAAKGLTLKDSAAYQAELEAAKKAADSEATKRNYTTIEQTIFETTGVAKKDGEKVHEYQKRAFLEAKAKADEAQAQAKQTETEVSEAATGAVELIKALQKQLKEQADSIEKLRNQTWEEKVTGQIDGTFSTIKLAVLEDSTLEDTREERETVFRNRYKAVKQEGGAVAYKDIKSGDLMIDPATGKPMNPEQIIKTNHKSWLAKDTTAPLGGIGLKTNPAKPVLEWGSTREEISKKAYDYAKEHNLAVNDKQVTEMRTKALKAAGLIK